MVYKGLHGLAPQYITELLLVKPVPSHSLRNYDSLKLIYPKLRISLVNVLLVTLALSSGTLFLFRSEMNKHLMVLNALLKHIFLGLVIIAELSSQT